MVSCNTSKKEPIILTEYDFDLPWGLQWGMDEQSVSSIIDSTNSLGITRGKVPNVHLAGIHFNLAKMYPLSEIKFGFFRDKLYEVDIVVSDSNGPETLSEYNKKSIINTLNSFLGISLPCDAVLSDSIRIRNYYLWKENHVVIANSRMETMRNVHLDSIRQSNPPATVKKSGASSGKGQYDDEYWNSVAREKALRDAGMKEAAKLEEKARVERLKGGGYTSPSGGSQVHYNGSLEQQRDLEAIDEWIRSHPELD